MFRKTTAFLMLALLAATVFVLPAAASDETQSIAPRYTYLDFSQPTLSISGKNATLNGSIQGLSSVTKLDYTVYLQVKSGSSWSDVSAWNGSKSSNKANYSFSGSVSAGKTYRNKTVVTAYASGGSETVTAYSMERTA